MVNPYEAPQTTALAPATMQLPHLALQQGARRCALGGKLILAAVISEILGIVLLIWIQHAKQHGPTNALNLGGWIFLSAPWLLLPVGAIVNVFGYSRFVNYLDHEFLVKLYRDCRLLIWIKFLLAIAVPVVIGLFEFAKFFSLLMIAVCAILVGSIVYSYFIQARAMRLWGEHFPYSIPDAVRKFYLYSNVAATMFSLGVAVHAYEAQIEPSLLLLIVVLLVVALSFVAFINFYKRLGKALEQLGEQEVNVPAIQIGDDLP